MVKLVIYDFDGVLTDNKVLTLQDGTEGVSCNRGDGWWVKEIRKLGIAQVILSTEKNPVVKARADKIGIPCLHGFDDKTEGFRSILKDSGFEPSQVCYVGNEMNDMACLRMAGYPVTPRDSHPEILKVAKWVIPCDGGAGIVRHLHDWLSAQTKTASAAAAPVYVPKGKEADLQRLKDKIQVSISIKQKLLEEEEALSTILAAGAACAKAMHEGKKVIFAGNGGSFADSMHLAAEFVSKLMVDREPLPAIALGCSNSNLTAIGNDYGYEHVFSREIKALGQAGDVFIAISTSGNSPNILLAVESAKAKGLHVFGLSGGKGGKLAGLCPTIKVPCNDTAKIQESHIMIGHMLCEMAEADFIGVKV
jgi:D-sedoheptulose 7-phosphate isomerase